MFFLNEMGCELINSSYVERFCVVKKPDAALIVASYGEERPPVTLGRYADADEAMTALYRLGQDFNNGEQAIRMMGSSYGCDPITTGSYHGKKFKNHGGS